MALLAEGGGDGPGTVAFRILAQEPNVLVQGGGKVVDAVTVTARDGIYGVVFSFTKSKAEWEGQIVKVAAADRALWIQAMAAHEHVVAMAYAQDVTKNGLLRDVMIMTVETDDGNHSAEVTWPLDTLNTPAAFAAVDKAYNHLLAVAAYT